MSTLEVQTAGSGSWTAAVNRYGGVWEVDSIPGSGPYNIQATLNDGSSVRSHHTPLFNIHTFNLAPTFTERPMSVSDSLSDTSVLRP